MIDFLHAFASLVLFRGLKLTMLQQKISSDSKMINYAQSSDILLPHDLPKCLQDSVIWLGDNGVFSSESGQNLPTSVQNAIRMVRASA